MNFTPFETPRLRLRPQEARDAGFALCIWGDPITGKYLSDTPLDAIDDLNEYMELLRHLSDAPDCYYMIAEDKVTGQPIGTCCAVIKNGGTCWDIGYCIHPTRWRQGYAKEMVTPLLHLAHKMALKHFSLMLPRKISAPAPSCVFLALPPPKTAPFTGAVPHWNTETSHSGKNYDVKQPYPYHQFHYCPALHCRRTPHPHRFGRPVRQRQNDAGRTAGRAFSSKHHRPHRRLLSPAIPACHGLGEHSLRQHGFKRLRAEVLNPARAGQPFSYIAYSCREGAYLPPVSCQPARLVIVEGSYSHHPALADCYDLRVFVTCSKAEQTRRLQAREGARYPAFAQRWIPLERDILQSIPLKKCRLDSGSRKGYDRGNKS